MNTRTKISIAKKILKNQSLLIHLDPRHGDVVIPPWLKEQAQVCLHVGYDMPIPIPDLTICDEFIMGTLSFNRRPFTCTIPWEAIFALVDNAGNGEIWVESMPEDVKSEIDREIKEAKSKSKPQLYSVTDESVSKNKSIPQILKPIKNKNKVSSGKKEFPSYLRVIK